MERNSVKFSKQGTPLHGHAFALSRGSRDGARYARTPYPNYFFLIVIVLTAILLREMACVRELPS